MTRLKILAVASPQAAKKMVLDAFAETGSQIVATARKLGVSVSTFYVVVDLLKLRATLDKGIVRARKRGTLGGRPRGRPKGARDSYKRERNTKVDQV